MAKKKEKYIQINKASRNRNKFQIQKNDKREDNDDASSKEENSNNIIINNKKEASQNNNRNKFISQNPKGNNLIGSYIEKYLKNRDIKLNKKFRRLNKKINNKDYKIKKLNGTIKGLKCEIKGLKKERKEYKDIVNAQDMKINAQDVKIKAQDVKINTQNEAINEQNEKIVLLAKIIHESNMHSNEINKYLMYVGDQFNSLFNSCKVLYIRKICDFILDGLINNYMNSIALTKIKFINNRGVQFPIIVFKKNIGIYQKYYLNLIIDYLMETKQNCSAIVHMDVEDKISKPIMKELFYILLNRDKVGTNKDNEFSLEIKEMTDIILENNDEINEEEEKSDNENVESDEISDNENDESDDKSDIENIKSEEISNESCDKNEDNKIRKLMLNNNNQDVSIDDLVKMLVEKKAIRKRGVRDIAIKVNQIINPSYFYNLWLKSFGEEDYKKLLQYKSFIKIEYNKNQKEMKEIIINLLPNYKINFFDEDPSQFSKKIKSYISSY